MNAYQWFESEVPSDLEIRQVYGFVFSPDGRILLLEDGGIFNLPGGKPEEGETLVQTLIRESTEEAQISFLDPRYIGYQFVATDDGYAQVRLVALIDQIYPQALDPSTGRRYKRLWVPPTLSNDLLKWNESGDKQIASATEAASKLGVSWNGNPLKYIDVG